MYVKYSLARVRDKYEVHALNRDIIRSMLRQLGAVNQEVALR